MLRIHNNCQSILYLGAKPIIFDVDEYRNLKIEDVISFIENRMKHIIKKQLIKLNKLG